mmetsp:Transcript_90092/g.288985  ORF Transcript_90092/g.288985 Transcript_90092/m.288985 type:complete len:222 (+) Transcript_90092:933-1598(+)
MKGQHLRCPDRVRHVLAGLARSRVERPHAVRQVVRAQVPEKVAVEGRLGLDADDRRGRVQLGNQDADLPEMGAEVQHDVAVAERMRQQPVAVRGQFAQHLRHVEALEFEASQGLEVRAAAEERGPVRHGAEGELLFPCPLPRPTSGASGGPSTRSSRDGGRRVRGRFGVGHGEAVAAAAALGLCEDLVPTMLGCVAGTTILARQTTARQKARPPPTQHSDV